MVVLAYLQRRWSLRGREEFKILSPSAEPMMRDLAFLWNEMPIFHYARDGFEKVAKSRASDAA